jgi:hypothetical protein
MTRTRISRTVITLGLTALLGLTACAAAPGAAGAGGPAPAVPAAATAPSAPSTNKADKADRADKVRTGGAARKLLRRNTLHGELTLQTRKGVHTVVVQRGTVTAVTATTLTVTSTDGSAQIWTVTGAVRIRKDQKKADRSALTDGATVRVTGARAGATTTARLIVA